MGMIQGDVELPALIASTFLGGHRTGGFFEGETVSLHQNRLGATGADTGTPSRSTRRLPRLHFSSPV